MFIAFASEVKEFVDCGTGEEGITETPETFFSKANSRGEFVVGVPARCSERDSLSDGTDGGARRWSWGQRHRIGINQEDIGEGFLEFVWGLRLRG